MNFSISFFSSLRKSYGVIIYTLLFMCYICFGYFVKHFFINSKYGSDVVVEMIYISFYLYITSIFIYILIKVKKHFNIRYNFIFALLLIILGIFLVYFSAIYINIAYQHIGHILRKLNYISNLYLIKLVAFENNILNKIPINIVSVFVIICSIYHLMKIIFKRMKYMIGNNKSENKRCFIEGNIALKRESFGFLYKTLP